MKTTKKEKLKLLETMLTIRAFEEKAAKLFQQNLITGFNHLSIRLRGSRQAGVFFFEDVAATGGSNR